LSDLIYQIRVTLLSNNDSLSEHIIHDGSTIGASDEADLSFPRCGLSPLNGRFKLQNGVLTYTHLGDTGDTYIGEQQCQHKKMYILDIDDQLKMGELKCLIEKASEAGPKLHIDQELLLQNPESESKPEDQLSKPVLDEEPDGMTLIGLEVLRPDGSTENTSDDEPKLDSASGLFEEPEITKSETEQSLRLKTNSVVSPPEDISPKENKSKKQQPKPLATRKAKPKKSKNDIEKIKKKTKKRKLATSVNLAGILPRIFGDVYNLVFFVMAFNAFSISQNEVLNSFANSILSLLTPLKSLLPPVLPEVQDVIFSLKTVSFLLAFFVWNVITGLCFSVNLGQWLVGLYSSGSFITRRLISPFRVLLSLITAPFLIFDIPILLGKRSFKEVMTGTETCYRSSKLTTLLTLIIVPAILSYLCAYEMLQDSESLKSFNNNPYEQTEAKILPPSKKISTSQKTKTIQLTSSLLGRSVKTTILEDIEIIAGLTTKGKKSILSYTLFDKGVSNHVRFNQKQFLVISELRKILEKDPLLKAHSKDLIPTDENSLEHHNSKIIKIIYDSLTLSKSTLISHVLHYGIFLNPYLKLRKKIFIKMGGSEVKNLKLLKKSSEYFLTYTKKDNHYLMTINDLGVSLYEFKTNGNNRKVNLSERYIEKIHPYGKVIKANEIINNYYEVLSTISYHKVIKSSHSKMILDEYMRLATDAFNRDDTIYTEVLLNIFKDNDRQFVESLKVQNDAELVELRLALNRIQKALYKKESDFFKLNNL